CALVAEFTSVSLTAAITAPLVSLTAPATLPTGEPKATTQLNSKTAGKAYLEAFFMHNSLRISRYDSSRGVLGGFELIYSSRAQKSGVHLGRRNAQPCSRQLVQLQIERAGRGTEDGGGRANLRSIRSMIYRNHRQIKSRFLCQPAISM